MKKRHSAEQIIRLLGEIERSGLKIGGACRPQGISEQTYYRWRNKYGGMEINEARRLRELEAGNSRLKRLVDAWRGFRDPRGGERKKMVSPVQRKAAVD